MDSLAFASIFFSQSLQNRHIHFVGIKGTGMVALAEICVRGGAIVSGSDVADIFYTDEILQKLNIMPKLFSKTNISNDIELVIYSSAYNRQEHVELLQATHLNIPVLLYTEALGGLSTQRYSIGIAGVHGKTTTTGLIGSLIKSLTLPAEVLAGSIMSSFGNFCTLSVGKKYFVAETCEYQRHFMSFLPKIIVLTGVESDHQDYYPDYESICNAFVDYICRLPQTGLVIYCGDDAGACDAVARALKKRSDIRSISYGFSPTVDFHIQYDTIADGKQYFFVPKLFDTLRTTDISKKKSFFVRIPGKHNILNAVAALIVAKTLYELENGIELLAQDNKKSIEFLGKIQDSFFSYTGSRRRSEIIGSRDNNRILVIDDYAHHPTALRTSIEGIRAFYPDRILIVDFMSHTYSRTAALLDDFARSFKLADMLILHKIYASAREIYNGSIDGHTLYERVLFYNQEQNFSQKVYYFKDFEPAIKPIITLITDNPTQKFLVLTMGAGDNWKVGKMILEHA